MHNSHRLLEKELFRLFEVSGLDYSRRGLSVFNWPDYSPSLQIYFLQRLSIGLNEGFDCDRPSEKLQSLLFGCQEATCG